MVNTDTVHRRRSESLENHFSLRCTEEEKLIHKQMNQLIVSEMPLSINVCIAC